MIPEECKVLRRCSDCQSLLATNLRVLRCKNESIDYDVNFNNDMQDSKSINI